MRIIIKAIVDGNIEEEAQFDVQQAVEDTLREAGYDVKDIDFYVVED